MNNLTTNSTPATLVWPLDTDVSPVDNSGMKKEKVSRTYKGHDGYTPIAGYLDLEGWCLEVEFRPGSQHSQKGTISFMKRVLDRARILTRKTGQSHQN